MGRNITDLFSPQTAITLTMAGYMLAQHPDVLKKLREEIGVHVGMRRPTYDDIRDMKYLRAFINGRLTVSVICILVDFTLNRGVAFVPGSVCVDNVYAD